MTGTHFSKQLLCVSPSLSPSRIWECYLSLDLCAQCRSLVQNSVHLHDAGKEKRKHSFQGSLAHTQKSLDIFVAKVLVGCELTSQQTRQFTCSTNLFDQEHQCHLGGIKRQFTKLAETLLKSSHRHSVHILARIARPSQLMVLNLLARLK